MYQGYVINAVSDPEFYARAYEDWCNKRAEDQSKLLQVVTESISLADDLIDEDNPADSISRITNALVSSYGDLSSTIPVPSGYVDSNEYLRAIATSVYNYAIGGDSAVTIRSYLPNGTVVDYATNIRDEIDRVTTDLHSIIALTAANAAAHFDNVVDRIATFRDKMSRVFSNGYTDLSNSTDYYVQLLEGVNDYDEYMNSISRSVNIDALAEDGTTLTTVSNDIYSFTGASPAGPLSFTKVSDAVSAVANAGVKMAKAVFNKVKTLTKKLFKKVKKYINETLVDPYDVYESSDGSAPSIAEFSVSISNYTRKIASDFSAFGGNDAAIELIKKMAADKDNVLKVATIFGEVIFNILGYEESALGPKIKYNMDFKPYSITDYTYRQFFSVISDQFNLTEINKNQNEGIYSAQYVYGLEPFQQLGNGLYSALSSVTDKYCSTKDSEVELYRGFVRSIYAFASIMEMARTESLYPDDPSNQELTCVIDPDTINRVCSGPYTNLDFVKISSFWTGSAFAISPVIQWSSDAPTQAATTYVFFGGIKGVIGLFLDIIVGVKLQDDLNPGTAPFISYRSNKEGLSPSAFHIKTDAQNQEAFNNFVVGCVVAVVAVLVVATCAVAAKKIVRRVSQSALAKKSALDSKMWNGEQLTKKEWRSYRRSSRLSELGSKASSQLQSGLTDVMSGQQAPDTSALIYSTITGSTL